MHAPADVQDVISLIQLQVIRNKLCEADDPVARAKVGRVCADRLIPETMIRPTLKRSIDQPCRIAVRVVRSSSMS